ncbi:MAG: Asp-tRNA(Asn)/Glu-tRNA(Gln) amidotransferase subunit GatB [Vicinamibacterales bacterium]
MKYEAVIGLEIHCQLLTATKIFCGCATAFGAAPNTQVCPVCLGLPGALPVLNRQAVEFGIRAALALGCTVNPVSVFARKNYFYPDLPKGYQISQYDQPLATGGSVNAGETTVRLTRIHMEEDAGKSLHHGFPESDRQTLLDYNRSGVPLIEIVTEPDLRSAADAADCFGRLREILVAIGVNDGNMEEGSLRCDANVSLRPVGTSAFGAKAEVKNVNSFRFLQKALEFEIERQLGVLESGGRVEQETRQWDSDTGTTRSMRSKEGAHDYRYFPEPDLPPLRVDEAWVARVRATMPELPEVRMARLVEAHGVSAYDADVLVRLIPGAADFFEATVAAGASAKTASNWIQGEVRRKLKEIGTEDLSLVPFGPTGLAELTELVDRGTISSSVAKDVFAAMWTSGQSARAIVEEKGLSQIGDRASLEVLVDQVIAANPEPVAQYRAGKIQTFGFLVGQVMKASKGKANPALAGDMLKFRIG